MMFDEMSVAAMSGSVSNRHLIKHHHQLE